MASNLPSTVIQSRLNKTLRDKWILLFVIPPALQRVVKMRNKAEGLIKKDSIQFSLSAVKLPNITVKAISQRFASGNLYVSSHSKDPFELLTIKFNIDNQYHNYISIYEWLNLLHDEVEAIPDAHNMISSNWLDLESYWTTLKLYALDEYNKVKIRFDFTQAFPTNLTGIDYDYKSTDEIEVSVNFAFSQLQTDYSEINKVLQ